MLCAEKQFCLELYWPALGSHWKTGNSFVAALNMLKWNESAIYEATTSVDLAKEHVSVWFVHGKWLKRQHTHKNTAEASRLLPPVRCSFRNSRPPAILNVNTKRAGPKVRWKIKNTVSGKGNEKESKKNWQKGWMFTSSVDYSKVLMCSFYYQTVVIC